MDPKGPRLTRTDIPTEERGPRAGQVESREQGGAEVPRAGWPALRSVAARAWGRRSPEGCVRVR